MRCLWLVLLYSLQYILNKVAALGSAFPETKRILNFTHSHRTNQTHTKKKFKHVLSHLDARTGHGGGETHGGEAANTKKAREHRRGGGENAGNIRKDREKEGGRGYGTCVCLFGVGGLG